MTAKQPVEFVRQGDGGTDRRVGNRVQLEDANGVKHSSTNPLSVELAAGSNGQTNNIGFADSAAIDAFSRLRVSNPITLFDSKNIFDDDGLAANVENQPLFYDNQQTAGAGTGTAYNVNESSQALSVSATTVGTRVRQTKMCFNYQPGLRRRPRWQRHR